MFLKAVTAVITVLIGIGTALVVYWLLNKIAEILPGRWERRIKPYLYILPAYLSIALYLLYPTVLTVVYSFKDAASENWVGFENFKNLFGDSGFRDTIVNTLLWMIIVPTFTVIIGLAVATLADRLSPRGEKTAKTLIFLPMAISMVGAGTVWRLMYDYRPKGQTQIGLQNAIWTKVFGGDPVPWLQQQTLHLNSLLLMIILLWASSGLSMVLLSAAVKGVPVDTLEAARIDGAGERQIFFRVIVPQIMGTIITVFITTLISVMKIFDIVYVMTSGSFNTNVIGLQFFNELFTNFDNGAAAAVVVLLIIATIPILWYQVRHFRAEEANA
jgi:alpha-glucoside transport system permease protein